MLTGHREGDLYALHFFFHFRVNIFMRVLLSWWFPVWTSIQHNRQTPRLGHCLLGSRDRLWRHRSWILPAAQHPNQDGSRVQEGRLKTSWHLCIQSTIEYIKPLLYCHIFHISFLYIYIYNSIFQSVIQHRCINKAHTSWASFVSNTWFVRCFSICSL